MGGNSAILKGPADYFELGVWNFRCDECYQKCKSSEAYHRWDNAMVCWRCIEQRNPQDFVHGIPDNQSPPWTRPTPPPLFVAGNGVAPTPAQAVGGSQLTGAQMTGAALTG